MSYTSGAWIKLLSYLVHISLEAACCIEREKLVLNGEWLLSSLNLFFGMRIFLLNIFFLFVHLMLYIPIWIKGFRSSLVSFYSFLILLDM